MAENISAIDAKILLLEAYEIAYEIYNHDLAPIDKPLALVAMHPKELYSNESRLYKTITRFAKYDIFNKFGLNLKEFLDLPREFTELIFAIVAEEARKEAPGLKEELKKIEAGAFNANLLRKKR